MAFAMLSDLTIKRLEGYSYLLHFIVESARADIVVDVGVRMLLDNALDLFKLVTHLE